MTLDARHMKMLRANGGGGVSNSLACPWFQGYRLRHTGQKLLKLDLLIYREAADRERSARAVRNGR